MLTHIRLKNFKSWRDTGPIRLAPLTVFFGANSSGKSSIGQFLMMLKKTAQSSDRKRVLHYGDKDSMIELGSFRDVVFNHDEDRSIDFECEWNLPDDLLFEDTRSGSSYRSDAICFESSIGLSQGKLRQQDNVVQKMSYSLKKDREEVFQAGMERDAEGSNRYKFDTKHFTPVRTQGKPWPLSPPTHFYGFSDEIIARHQNLGFLRDLTLALENRLNTVYYLGPLRERLHRFYTWSGEKPEDVGWKGENTIQAILAAEERKISKGRNKQRKSFAEVIARWLANMKLISSFEVQSIGKGRQEYEVRVKITGSREEVLIPDVGFGVSQVLPVLVQCFYAPPGATIIMEQPEIHLHPSVQSSLADLFIEVIKSREGGEDRGIQLLIETHSEHFLRRLQRRIAENNDIKADDTALYFCRKTSSESKMEALRVNMFGSIENWPDGFFGDEMADLVAMTKAAMEREMEES